MFPRFAFTFLLAGACLAQNIDSRMDQVVESFVANKQFMGSVLVARGDQVLFSEGYGSANLEWWDTGYAQHQVPVGIANQTIHRGW